MKIQPWTFLYATDIHVGSPKSFRFAPAFNENWLTVRTQMIEINPDLLLIGGDVARDGNIHKYELENVKRDFDNFPFPYRVIPGNMDTGNKFTKISGDKYDDLALNISKTNLKNYVDVFGELWWSIVHKNVRFSGFCDILLGSGLDEEKKLLQWLEKQKFQVKTKYHVWIIHYALFIDSIDEPYRSMIKEIFISTGTNVVISGHVHCRKTCFCDGIRFDIAPSTAFPQWGKRWKDGDVRLGFLKYDVSDKGINCTFVPLNKVSKTKGYGPSGHPKPEQRNYSIAWEK